MPSHELDDSVLGQNSKQKFCVTLLESLLDPSPVTVETLQYCQLVLSSYSTSLPLPVDSVFSGCLLLFLEFHDLARRL